MPVWNFIRTLSGRGELIPEPPSSKKSKKKSKEKELIKENDPETIEPENDEPVRKGKKSKKGKGKEKTVRYNKLPSEERTSKSLADAQKENEEIWRKQREKKEQEANRKGETEVFRETRWLGLRRGIT